ncbi:RNA-binding S4 domain-containing protein [Spongiactinospora sp. TRM90649]|uniref:RNA-binding S4 domain-containing protein n=1 Tax=Spongiactinospora sp. TRM90649 TaxID=3031114 RepID=UPI0023F69D49|nr:RNA-binding S4 domain-containing protein [Spongiactinospora sp. TRM90649]MDF5752418.1 RNA-binding S4 domain-containing protein [Spongiactinospora sp. TRM90649]
MSETFELETEHIPLCDLLKVCAVAETGGVAGLLIADGEVRVDGQVELRKRAKIRPGQVVTGEGFEIHVVAAS